MVPAVIALTGGGAAEFTSPQQQSVLEQAALLEVRDERGDGLIDLARVHLHALAQVVVMVPAAT